MPEPRAEDRSLTAAVDAAVAEVRHRNARVVAALRVALRALLSINYLYGVAERPGPSLRALSLVNLAHLAVGVGVMALLWRRWRPRQVALAAALLDVAAVAAAGWCLLALAPADVTAGSRAPLGGLMVLTLLLAAVALPARQAAAVALLGVSAQVALAAVGGLERPFVLALGILLAAAAGGAIWIGLRLARLAARVATEADLAAQERDHAAALARAGAELAAQRDEVLAAQRQAELVVRRLVHDLKNPLAAVLQYVDLAAVHAARPDGAPRVREHLSHAASEGRRLADLIGDVLLVSGLEAGARRPARDALGLGDLLAAVEQSWGARAREAGVALRVSCEEDVVVRLDHDLVRRLVENLVSNALRRCRPGELVELAGAREADGVRIAVRNTGAPVPPEVRAHLLDRAAGARAGHDAAPGLTLCRLVAEAHGGGIALVDRPGWSVSVEATLAGAAPPAEAPAVAPRASAG